MAEHQEYQEHQLERISTGWRCTVCHKTWQAKPRTECGGLRVFAYAQIDWERLATVSGLRRRGLRLAPGQQPAGCYERSAGRPRQVLLYWVHEAASAKALTEAQRQALERAREGWRRWLTCESCGGKIEPGRRRRRLRLCWGCEEAQRVRQQQQEIRAWLREELARDMVVLDTETTGLPEDPGFQVVEIAVIDGKGKLLFRSLIQPDAPVTPGARALHGISDEALQHAPPLTERWGELCAVLEGCASIWAYNAEFDRLALLASARRHRLEIPGWLRAEKWHCAMELYAQFQGLDYWMPLERVCANEGIAGAGWHAAERDARAVLGLLRMLAGVPGLEEEKA